jgi:peptide deformylase
MPLTILDVGDPVLRQIARPLLREEIRGSEIQLLIGDMRDTMRAAPGVGLAAPQVGRSVQLAVIEDLALYHKDVSSEQLAAKERTPIPFHVVINPEVVWRSDEETSFFEGCLSLGGYSAIVQRAHAIKIKYLDDRGDPQSMDARGWHARVLQHEIDHLQGCLYVDRMQTRTFTSLENLSQFWKHLPPADVLADLG